MDTMKEKGLFDDTAVFIFSDHGDFTGDYGMVEKAQNMFYDCLTRVPFIVRPPKGQKCQPGIRDGLVELIDFYATVLDYADVKAPHNHFGMSLRAALEGKRGCGRDAVFCEGGRRTGEIEASERESTSALTPDGLYWPRVGLQQIDDPPYHSKGNMIRTRDFKYVQRLYEKDELYHLEIDPGETRNVIDDPAYAPVLAALKDRLLQWYQETGDTVPLKTDSR
jgi:arylsulfatase A-like enzyme